MNNEEKKIYTKETHIPASLFEPLNIHAIKDEPFKTQPIGFFRDAFHRFVKSRSSVVAFWIIVVITLFTLIGPSLTGYGFNEQNIDRINMPPRIPYLEKLGIADGSRLLENRVKTFLDDPNEYPEGCVIAVHNERIVMKKEVVDVEVNYYKYVGADDEYYWFGTDYLGRDLFTRLFRGARISLIIAVVSVVVNVIIGMIYGAIAGYYGGAVDLIMMRICEILNSIPFLVLMILFILYFGTGMFSIIAAFLIKGWVGTAVLTRTQFYRFKGREYVLAARVLGVKDRTLIFRHILPNCLGPIITSTMIAIPSAIFSESFLAYLGLSIQAPEPSIGVLLADGQSVLLHFPYQTLFPAIIISLLMISFNLLSNGLRDALDPTKRGEE